MLIPSVVICPAYAGMILLHAIFALMVSDLSRVCGDDPMLILTGEQGIGFVPRMRG